MKAKIHYFDGRVEIRSWMREPKPFLKIEAMTPLQVSLPTDRDDSIEPNVNEALFRLRTQEQMFLHRPTATWYEYYEIPDYNRLAEHLDFVDLYHCLRLKHKARGDPQSEALALRQRERWLNRELKANQERQVEIDKTMIEKRHETQNRSHDRDQNERAVVDLRDYLVGLRDRSMT